MINSFTGIYQWLSNFYPSEVDLDGIIYQSLEQAYQAAKTTDHKERLKFLNITPAAAKKMGRKLKIRDDWESIKIDVMYKLLQSKFSNQSLREKLLATGDHELIEGNYWGDVYWGVCRGSGENNLGKLLMRIRNEFRSSVVSS